jgi:uncharacterized protein (TIGR02145 family)
MKHIKQLLFLFLLLSCRVMAQDVRITLTTSFQQMAVPLDSILMENLTNGTSVMLNILPPAITTCEIDLSKGKIIYGLDELQKPGYGFFPYSNTPGELKFYAVLPSFSPISITLYDLLGRPISSDRLDCSPGISLVTCKPGGVASGIIVAEGNGYHQSFKATGGKEKGQPWIVSSAPASLPGLNRNDYEKAALQTGNFIFTPGDTVRFTVYAYDIYSDSLSAQPLDGDSLVVAVTRPCPGTHFVTDVDGNTYTTVQIGNQCWMRENMNATHYSDGTALLDGTGVGHLSQENYKRYWFNYEDNPDNGIVYGKLYTWAGAMNWDFMNGLPPEKSRGICPVDWHVPSDDEWIVLEMFLGMSSADAYDCRLFYRGTNEGGKLKEAGTGHWDSPNSGATNESGFTALPGGGRLDLESLFVGLNQFGRWWTSSNWYTTISPSDRILYKEVPIIARQCITGPNYGLSVRCVKDN